MAFKFLVGRAAKMVGRNVNSVFFTTLYREIFKEVFDLTNDEEKTVQIVKQLGILGTSESAHRQESLMRLFPGTPKRIMEYFDVIYYVIFGTKLDNFSLEYIEVEGHEFADMVLNIEKCAICGGYGSLPEDTFDCTKIPEGNTAFAAGLVGMLQETANFILHIKESPYQIIITETKCFCRGDSYQQLYCKVIPREKIEDELKKESFSEKNHKSPIIDVDFDHIEEVLTKPLKTIKAEVTKMILEKTNMTPTEFLDHFANYEDDVIRIFGFLIIHILNEKGRIIEGMAKNETFSKIIGHLFNNAVDMTNIYVPRDVISDYQKLLIEFLTGLASDKMVESFRKFPATEITTLFFEGMKKALLDLGVNFEGMKTNIWEELEVQKLMGGLPVKNNSDEELTDERRNFIAQTRMKIFQEIFMLMNAMVSLPTRILISNAHESSKTALNSAGEIFTNVKNHIENIFDLVEELK